MHVSEWLPDQPIRIGRIDWSEEADDGVHLPLRAGHIVVLDRQPWRILEIDEYRDPWPKTHEKAWRSHVELWKHSQSLHRADGQPATVPPARADFYKRPVVLVLRNENLPRSAPKRWCAQASHDWQVLPEHYSVCRACGELPPCRNGEYWWQGGPRRPEHNGAVTLIVPPGCCMGCAEHIKPRTRTVRFPGPNLWYPDLEEGSAVFHARASCADQVDCYRAQWTAEYAPAVYQSAFTPKLPDGENFALPQSRRVEPREPADWHHAAHDTEIRHARPSSMRPAPQTNGAPLPEQGSPARRASASEGLRTSPPSADAPMASTYQVPRSYQEPSEYQEYQEYQDARGNQDARGHQEVQGHPDSRSHQSSRGHQDSRGYQDSLGHQDLRDHQNLRDHQEPRSHQEPRRRQEPSEYPEIAVRPAARRHHPYPVDAPAQLREQAQARSRTQLQAPEPAARPVPPADAAAPTAFTPDIEAVHRLMKELGLAQAGRPAPHDTDQVSQVMEELTAAVRNVALCLNATGLRDRP